jgi:hypothetical protein
MCRHNLHFLNFKLLLEMSLNFAEVINKAIRPDFDDIIIKAKLSENRMYSIEKGQSLFKIKRRDCKRLQLICKKEASCKFSINYGVTKCTTMTELHSCSFSKLLKKQYVISSISSDEIHETPPILKPVSSTCTMTSPTPVQESYSSSSSMTSSENISEASRFPPSTADFIWSCNENHETPPIPKPSKIVSESHKFLEELLSIIDTKDYTSDQKIQLSYRVQELLKTKCGFPLYREYFYSCSSAERNNMIFQLQLLNSMKKDFEESRKKKWSDILTENIHPLKRYRRDNSDYDDNDEDEVTYLDY